MRGYDIMKEMRDTGGDKRYFIKWWRKENDFADYELVDTFLANLRPEDEFAGYELLTMEQMWSELRHRVPKRVELGRSHGKPVIHWQHMVREEGTMREDVLPFDAASLMTVFDEETQGDTLC